jgi:hypothetical protein
MCLRTPRTSLRSHSTCHSYVIVVFFFFFFFEEHRASPSSRDRVINAPCDPSAPRFLTARTGLHFGVFYRVLLRVVFRHFFDLSSTFFHHQRHHHTSFTSYHHHNLLSAHHEIIKTRQRTKNGQKWLFLRVSKKGLKMAVFGLFLTSSKNRVFLTSTHHQHIKK